MAQVGPVANLRGFHGGARRGGCDSLRAVRALPSAWWVPGIAPHERRTGDRPAWAALVEEVLAGDGDASAHGLVAWASERVTRLAPRTGVATDAVAADFGKRLRGRLLDVAAPAGLAEVALAHPVLARLLGETTRLAVEAHVELLDRFAADRTAVVTTLLGAVDPGPVVTVESWRGDPHRRGRSVSVVGFADGRRVVYRPRDVTTHTRFAELVAWLDAALPGFALRTPSVVARAGYGWLEFVEAAPPEGREGAGRYFRRLGALLALLHAVRATDMHHENVLADADRPVLVDVETLCHPTLPHPRAADPAMRALTSSVYRTGLLPEFVAGASGIRDISGAGRAGPDPADHATALLDGFRQGYDAILRDRPAFTALVAGLADVEVRVVVRSTRHYAGLIAAARRPDLLADAADRDRVLAAGVAASRFGDRLTHPELADLWAGDIPLFTGRPDSRDLWTSNGQRLPDMVERTALADVLDTVAAMSEVDRRDQEWIISAALATRHATDHHDVTPVPDDVTGTPVDPQRLLTAACAIADQIVSRSMADGNRVNWLGLELVDDRQWLVLPMGAGLADGYLGVALFLAQLAEVSGIARYGRLAMDAITAIPPLFERLSAQPAMVAAIGWGGLHGLGGIAYGLARIGVLRDDADVRGMAATAVELAASPAAATDATGWATGTAGCLAAMTAVHAELALPAAAELALRCADRLADATEGLVSAGFADGSAGVAWALSRYADRLPAGVAPRHTDAARAAAEVTAAASGDPVGLGWCAGLAGLALGGGTGVWTRALVDRSPLRDLSLCHGELGIADAAAVTATQDAEPARRRYVGLILDTIDRYGPRCGTPAGVPTPGLLTGLAGIGYGLLRLGFDHSVPSALLLEPTGGGT
jgi:class II lanthipeptide synthase